MGNHTSILVPGIPHTFETFLLFLASPGISLAAPSWNFISLVTLNCRLLSSVWVDASRDKLESRMVAGATLAWDCGRAHVPLGDLRFASKYYGC